MPKQELPTSVGNCSSRTYLGRNPTEWASFLNIEARRHRARTPLCQGIRHFSTDLEGKMGVNLSVLLTDFIMLLRCLGRRCSNLSEPPRTWGRASVWEVWELDLGLWYADLRIWSKVSGEWQDRLLGSLGDEQILHPFLGLSKKAIISNAASTIFTECLFQMLPVSWNA